MNDKPLKIMYLSPVGVDSLDGLFEEMVKDTKDPETEVHITSLKDSNGSFSHVEFRSYEAMATAGIINATVCAAKEGFDALAIGCFYDTALHDAREVSGDGSRVAGRSHRIASSHARRARRNRRWRRGGG